MTSVNEPTNLRGFPPKAFLIGAQKAGTTFLSFLLDQHPEITLSAPKEPHYFTLNWKRGVNWYSERFVGPPETVFMDASPSYTNARLAKHEDSRFEIDNPFADVPRRIHELSPHARFIYLLRDPVERTYSSYWHEVQKGNETRPFRQALSEDSSYLRKSAYARQLSLYLEFYGKESLLCLLFEQLKKEPVGTAQKCFRFLGVREDVVPSTQGGRNESFTYRGLMQSAGGILARANPLIKAVKPWIPSRATSALKQMLTKPVPQMGEGDRAFLTAHFSAKNRELENIIGIPLRQWWS